jgi:predicted methyltransferase
MFEIDWAIKLTDLLVIAGFAGTVGAMLFRSGRVFHSITSMQIEIKELKDVAKSVAEVLTTVAIQKVELDHMREDIDEIKKNRRGR